MAVRRTGKAAAGKPRAVTPVFLLSLPRCGSTLVQRVLSGHPQIATTPEPWLLLPLLGAMREEGTYADYGHYLATRGLADLCAALPGGAADYRAALAQFARDVYQRASPAGSRYFLDKTPRYHQVVDDLFEMFPDGAFIFLWRHPLAMLASMVESFGRGRWILYVLKIDLYRGLDSLVRARAAWGDRACSVCYEDFVRNPQEETARLVAHLGLDPAPGMVEEVGARPVTGALGDRSGTARYGEVSAEPVGKWRTILANPVRKWWCRRYLRWIGAARLAVMGYDLDRLLAELDAVPTNYRHVFSDLAHLAFGVAYSWAEPGILRDKLRMLGRRRDACAHR